jgi:hypothetical protein
MMKKLIITIIISLVAVSGFAQPEPSKQQQRNQRYQQIQSAKIAFFTSEIQLTPKEAEDFWPVYNQYWREREVLMRRTQGAMRSIIKTLSGEEKRADAELKAILESYISNNTDEGAIQRAYFERFLKILSVEKVARLYKAEEEFRMKMIHQLRGVGEGSEKK